MKFSKVFAMLFAAVTAFYVLYFIWSFFNEATIFQLIQRGTSILIFAFITYSMHAEIRSRVRYGKDAALYGAVQESMDEYHAGLPRDDMEMGYGQDYQLSDINVYDGPGQDPRGSDD